MRLPSRIAFALLAASWASRVEAQDRDWNPESTWVFVVGVLEWEKAEDWSSFSSDDRKDAELVEFFRSAGVAENRIVYLQDSAATLQAIRDSLAEFLGRTDESAFLVLYYCGHGYKDDDGSTHFANFDAGSDSSTTWSSRELVESIEASFRGSSALLAADCCTSGGLAASAETAGGRVSYAVLTSSSANEGSTGDWTFTRGLLDALRGEPLLDLDSDGRVTLEETGGHLVAEMAEYHEQLATLARTGNFDASWTVARAAGPRPEPPIGQKVVVDFDGTLWRGRIVEARPDEYRIRWITIGYDTEKSDEWVPRERAMPIESISYPAGAVVEVEWKDQWYPATIIEAAHGVHKIHYEGYDDAWDEWVPSARIREPEH